MEKRKSFLSDYLSNRANFIEIIIVGLIISFGINLLSNKISGVLNLSDVNTVLLGFFLCILSTIYLLYKFLNVGLRYEEYTGLILSSKDNNTIIDIPRYEYLNDLYRYFNSAFTENNALKILWDKESLADRFTVDDERKVRAKKELHSIKLIKEATEYFMLSTLSTHLTDYFNKETIEKSNLIEFNRKDIPSVLLSNRFLELFSRPMSERPAFVNSIGITNQSTIVASYTRGARFDRFDLVLPKESLINRIKDGITIETSRFSLTLSVLFDAYNSVLPVDFASYYLGRDGKMDLTEYEIKIGISVNFKMKGFLSSSGWEYYQWVDSFLEKLNEQFSFDEFIKRIGWENAVTVLKCNDVKLKNQIGSPTEI